MTLDTLSKIIAERRAEMKKNGKRTTEPTRQLFLIPAYDWQEDPKGYRIVDGKRGALPPDRCTHCGHKYVGWKKYPFCNICHLAHVGDMIIDPLYRAAINMRQRIPEDMTEEQYIIREKMRNADEEYNKKNNQPIESNFKRANDLL